MSKVDYKQYRPASPAITKIILAELAEAEREFLLRKRELEEAEATLAKAIRRKECLDQVKALLDEHDGIELTPRQP